MSRQESYIIKKRQRANGLSFFFNNLQDNHYDYASSKLIEELEKKVINLKYQIEKDEKGLGYMKYVEVELLEKNLMAVSEMKILYGYKNFETHLKWLLKSEYSSEINEKKLFQWNNVESFLNSKKINPEELDGYPELMELRNLNNSIKHSFNPLDKTTQNIIEFRNKKELTYKDLLIFYSRVEESAIIFLKSLSTSIEQDIYVFDDNRIEKISDKLILQMDNQTVNKLIDSLKKKNN